MSENYATEKRPENCYENFRTVLTMNLCNVLPSELMKDVLEAVDITMNDFEICRKQMEIIPSTPGGLPEVAKIFIAAKSIAGVKKSSLKQYRYKLLNFFNALQKSYMDVQANDIRIYLHRYKIERNAADSYLENIRVMLHDFFQWLVDNDYLVRNPCAKVEKIHYQQKRREPLDSFSLERLRWNTKNPREKALIDFFFSTGCRVSECSDVCLTDIDWKERSVVIRHGKGDKARIVYFNAEAEVSMREYLRSRSDQTDALFVSMRRPHHPIGQHALEDIITAVARRCGLHVYPHRLRHTFATEGLRGGMSLETLQALLGHAKPETTLIYAHQDQRDIQREHRRVYA